MWARKWGKLQVWASHKACWGGSVGPPTPWADREAVWQLWPEQPDEPAEPERREPVPEPRGEQRVHDEPQLGQALGDGDGGPPARGHGDHADHFRLAQSS